VSRTCFAIAFLSVLALGGAAHAASARALPDSTTVSAWRLPNGLEVRVRDVPGANAVAVTLGYRAGSFLDDPSTPGLASVLALVRFTAPVGDVPERSFAEMSSVRPLGWGVTTNARLSLLTEVGLPERFAGLLHEVARRAHGVQVTDSCLAHAVAFARRDAGQRRFGKPEPALYERVRDIAQGFDEQQVLDRASGKGLLRLTPARVDTLMSRYYGASNAVLVLVGDFGGVPLEQVVAREFGDIGAGTAQPDPPAPMLSPARRTTTLDSAPLSLGVVGILAPAIEDTTSAEFYLDALVTGGWWKHERSDSDSRLDSYFQYSIFDEPDMVRYDVELRAGPDDPNSMANAWNNQMDSYAELLVTSDVYNLVRETVGWMLGAPLGSAQRRQAATTPAFVSTIATTTASRALWKGDAFWDGFLHRFMSAHFANTTFRRYKQDPAHQVVLVLKPRR